MIWLAIVLFGALLLWAVKKNKWGPSIYLIAIYLFSLMMSTVYNQVVGQIVEVKSVITYFLLLTLYFLPYFVENKQIQHQTDQSYESIICKIGYIMSLVLVGAMLLYLPTILNYASIGVENLRDADVNVSAGGFLGGIGSTIIWWFSGLSYLCVLYFFYVYCFYPHRKVLVVLLFIASLSAICQGLAVGGRTKIIYWTMFVGFCLVLFWQYMNRKQRSIMVIVMSLFMFYFILPTILKITQGRFGDAANESLIGYMGQSFINFVDFFNNYNTPTYSFQRIFPLTSKLLGNELDLDTYRYGIISTSGMNIGIFYTMLGDFMVDIGMFGAIVYSVLYFLITRHVLRKNLYLKLSTLSILTVLYQIPLHGLFYYSYWRSCSSFCIIITLVIAVILRKREYDTVEQK